MISFGFHYTLPPEAHSCGASLIASEVLLATQFVRELDASRPFDSQASTQSLPGNDLVDDLWDVDDQE